MAKSSKHTKPSVDPQPKGYYYYSADEILRMATQYKPPKPKFKPKDIVKKIGEKDTYIILGKIIAKVFRYKVQKVGTDETYKINETELELVEKAPK
ncbi:hypothetical protein [Edaphocola flava]|uniref:hypothetical protein n=1 Tax=Edaphocola flava TaxID=2499629 RepID=UPI00100ACE1F|nr:hypothetical protein [Edaphocola flava]